MILMPRGLAVRIPGTLVLGSWKTRLHSPYAGHLETWVIHTKEPEMLGPRATGDRANHQENLISKRFP